MKFSTRRALAALAAASCLAIPASASAMPDSAPGTTHSDAAQSGSQPTTDRTDAAHRCAITAGRRRARTTATSTTGIRALGRHPGRAARLADRVDAQTMPTRVATDDRNREGTVGDVGWHR